MSNKFPLLLIIAVMASMLVVSCGSSKHTVTAHNYHRSTGGDHRDSRTFEIPKSIPPQSHALLEEAKRWIGTPYRYGGDDKHGMDCSGLVMTVYRSALDIKLPRSSSEQAEYCSPLQKNQLMPGDLLFFCTGSSKKISHVGIYIGDNKMVHSSTSSGVVVSDLAADYYVNTYAGAGSVEKYRAMISKSKQPVPTIKGPEKETMPPIATQPAPIIIAAPIETSTQGISNVKSETTSEPKDVSAPSSANAGQKKSESKPAAGKKTVVPVTPVTAVTPKTTPVKTASATPGKTEPTTDEARKAVLNSIIEQKIDSILKP